MSACRYSACCSNDFFIAGFKKSSLLHFFSDKRMKFSLNELSLYKCLYIIIMKFYHDLGFLIFGSRLRRLSEYYIAEINKVYQIKNIDFEAAWFPLFYFLSVKDEVNLREIADELQVSHSAISQLVKNLRTKGLVAVEPSKTDRRQNMVKFTPQGELLMEQLRPVWESISGSMEHIYANAAEIINLLPALSALENHFEENPLSDIILKTLNNGQDI